MDVFEFSAEKRQATLERLNHFLKGDENAVKLAVELLFVGHLWDDLIDRDKSRDNSDISNAFTFALAEIPLNPYYPAVYHLIRNAITQWECSNVLMFGNEDETLTAFLIRNALMEVVHYLIFLVGGQEWARAQGPEFWRFLSRGISRTYREYVVEAKHA